MREIKFRGKNPKDKWVYGSLVINETENERGKFQVAFIVPGLPCASDGGDFYTARMERVKIENIGEYIGLKDKNGTDIFEGDILCIRTFSNLSYKAPFEEQKQILELFTLEDLKGEQEAESVSVVQQEEGLFMVSIDWENDTYISCLFGDIKKSNPIFEYEVIGNIFENPDIKPQYADRYKHLH